MRENTKKNIRISALGYEKADVTITTGTARKLEAGASRLTPLDPAQLELTKVVMGITIVDAHGHWNVPKAKVTLGSLSGVTDVDGFVNFHILPGRYKDTVIADGYLKATGELDVPESQQQEFQKIYIRPDPAMAVELTISVVDAADGKGVPDAQVNVGVTGAVTNASGVVTWQESPGTYPFSVTAKGYSRETGKITVTKAKQETFIIRRI
jgi:uncharacterized membrane protein